MKVLDTLRWWAGARPDEPAIVTRDRTCTYAEVLAGAGGVSALLAARGVGPGDRVAIVGPNSVEWCLTAIGTMAAQAVAVPLNNRWVAQEVSYAMHDTSPKVVFAPDSRSSIVRDALSGWTDVALEPLTAPADATLPPSGETRDSAILAIIYTSGSTARPKGVVFTDETILGAAFESAMLDAAFADHPRLLLPLPLGSCAGIIRGVLNTLIWGGTVFLEERVEPDAALQLIQRERITVFNSQPYVFERLSEAASFASTDLTSLRLTTIAGATVHRALIERWHRRGVLLRQSWGMTETAGSCSVNSPQLAYEHPEFCGSGGPFTRIRTVRDDATPCDDDEPGEILVQGPSVTPGYWNNPDATASAKRSGGWFATGDIGRLDRDGNLVLVGRKKDMIISGGINIAPAEIEEVLAQFPGVIEVVVFGVPDERFGEAVGALVIGDGSISASAVQTHCRACLADFKVPRRLAILAEPLPRLANGKIARQAVREAYADIVAGSLI